MHIDIALLGFGNVARALARLLVRKTGTLQRDYGLTYRVTGIATRSRGCAIDPDGLDLEAALRLVEGGQSLESLHKGAPVADTLAFIAACPADLVMEATWLNPQTGQPATDYVRAALAAGRHVVTANKGPVAFAYRELMALARQQDRGFFFESTVMDGAPVLGMGREAFLATTIERVRGILNSTTNYILTRLEQGVAFADAVAEAQRIGVAEADPSNDLEGWDATVKIVVLANVLMGADLRPADVDRTGITGLTGADLKAALDAGERVKLLCDARGRPGPGSDSGRAELMFLSNLSIRRPVFAAVVMLALVTLGIFSYRHLNIDLYPDVEIPVLTITTAYKGAPPESVEREITRRIEEAVNTVQGIKHISSTSQEGLSSIAVEFTLETRINDAAQETRAKVSAIRGDLPKESEESVIQKLDFSAAPVISLAVRSDVLDARDLTTLVDKRIKRRIENISGVGRVDLVGNAKREVNVWLDPVHLDALGLGLNEIISGLHEENVDTPLGRLNDQGYEMPVRISGKPKEVWEYPEMVVAWREGRPIRLKDFARIQDGVEEQRTLALVDGEPAVALNVLKQSGANTVAVADRVKRVAADLTAELPAGVRIQVVRDESNFIRESVEDVQMTLILGGLLTIFIVFCFLNSWRSTVITGLTLPISVISSFIIIMALGFTLNVMTLMGLSLAIGLLIDDAIVVR